MERTVSLGLSVALLLLVSATASAQGDIDALVSAADSLERAGDLEAALAAWSRVVEAAPGKPGPWVRRGQVHFRLARIDESLADFDRAVAIDPASEPYLWQRGITQWYAGKYEACRRQFEIHRTVNPNDVENAAWHYLCVARAEGPEAARASLLPVGPDSRIPLRTIYELYRGRETPEAVMDAASSASPSRLESALFYGDLYIGLYRLTAGEEETGLENLRAAAARDFPHYMREVARVHLELEVK